MSIRRLREVMSDASKYKDELVEGSMRATNLRETVKNADTDYHKSLANKMALAQYGHMEGYTPPNKYSWEKPKGGKKKTKRRTKQKRRNSRRHSRKRM